MKITQKKIRVHEPDDSLFGLLSAYKPVNTYFRLFVNEEKKQIIFQMTDNPKHFSSFSDEQLAGYRMFRRSELEVAKLSVKYLSPRHITEHFGENLGISVSTRKGKISNFLNKEKKIYQLETSLSQSSAIIALIKKIILLSPQKKYEIIEKYLSHSMKPDFEE